MLILQRTVSGAPLRLAVMALALGGILLAQNTSDKPSDNAPEQGQETAYKLGEKGVIAPRAVYAPNPQFSDEARKAHFDGVVTLRATVSASGSVTDVSVTKASGMGLNEKAIEAVRQWKFKPGTKDGKPVAVEVPLQIVFHLSR